MNRFLSTLCLSVLLMVPSFLHSSIVGEFVAEGLGDAVGDVVADGGSALGEDVFADLSEQAAKTVGDALEAGTSSLEASLADALQGMSEQFQKLADEAGEEVAQQAMKDFVQESIGKTIDNLTTDAVSETTNIMTTLTEGIANGAEDAYENTINGLVEAGDLTADQATALTSAVDEAGSLVADTADDVAANTAEDAATKAAEDTAEDAAAKTGEDAAENAGKDAAEDAAKKKGNWATRLLAKMPEMLIGGAMMMLPSTIETILVQMEERKALLGTIGQPVKIGKFVGQIPNEFIVSGSPGDSLFLYALIPVSSTSKSITDDMTVTWPGLGDRAYDSITANCNTDAGIDIKRYQLDATYYGSCYWACVYPATSYATSWATTYMNSTSAPGKNVVLNNGYVYVSDGTSGGNAPAQLAGDISQGLTVYDALNDFSSELAADNINFEYIQYVNMAATSVSDGGDDSVYQRVFNCACLEQGDYSSLNSCDGDNCESSCVTDDDPPQPTCMLTGAFSDLAAGCIIGTDGKQSTNAEILDGEALTEDELANTGQTSEITADTSTITLLTSLAGVAAGIGAASLNFTKNAKGGSMVMPATATVVSSMGKVISTSATMVSNAISSASSSSTTTTTDDAASSSDDSSDTDSSTDSTTTTDTTATDATDTTAADASDSSADSDAVTAQAMTYPKETLAAVLTRNQHRVGRVSDAVAQWNRKLTGACAPSDSLVLDGEVLRSSSCNRVPVGKNLTTHKGEVFATALDDDDSDSSGSTAITALGPILPVFGWDADFEDMLKAFTTADDLEGLGLTEQLGNKGISQILGAPLENYAAKNVQVYLCSNTPWTRALRSAMGTSATFDTVSDMSPTGAIVDMIVFLDEDGTQVPLLTVEPVVVYTSDGDNPAYLPQYVLNPSIRYWMSLVSLDVLKYVDDSGTEFQVKFDLACDSIFNANDIDSSKIDGYFDTVGNINSSLKEQLITHKTAMVEQFLNGPFGKDKLQTDTDLKFSDIGVTVYTGMNCTPIPIGNDTVSEYIIPISTKTGVAAMSLPSQDVNYYLGASVDDNSELPDYYGGLVTDILYTMRNGYLVPALFGNSSFLDSSFNVTQAGTGAYNLLGLFEGLADKISDEITAARTEFLADLAALKASNISVTDCFGFAIGSGSMIGKLFSMDSMTNGCPIWKLDGASLEDGMFVAVSSVIPGVSTVTPLTSSSQIDDSTMFVDLVSGLVINSVGGYVIELDSSSGLYMPVSLETADLLSDLRGRYNKAFGDSFDTYYNYYTTQYSLAVKEKLYPNSYGNKTLGIYRGDKDRMLYLYWTMNGTQITDYFITYNSDNGLFGIPLESDPSNLVSLTTGKVYNKQGSLGLLDDMAGAGTFNKVYAYFYEHSTSVRQSEIDSVSAMAKAIEDQLEAESQAMIQAYDTYQPINFTEDVSVRSALATRLQSQSFQLYPYDLLKYDSQNKKYYVVVPSTGTDTGTSYYYMDLDTPNSGQSASGNSEPVAAIFNDSGTIDQNSYVSSDAALGLRDYYGVVVGSDGTQSLGAPNMDMPLNLSGADLSITAGSSGDSMQALADLGYPMTLISEKMTYDDKEFYFYYSKNVKSFYALVNETNAGISYWVSMEDGSKYNLDGSRKPVTGLVAFGPALTDSSSSDATVVAQLLSTNDSVVVAQDLAPSVETNPMLLSQDSSGFLKCWMSDPNKDNAFTEFGKDANIDVETKMAGDGATPIGVTTMNSLTGIPDSIAVVHVPYPTSVPPYPALNEATDYYVTWDLNAATAGDPTQFTVDTSYTWNSLRLMNDNDTTHQDLSLVSQGNVVKYAVYAGAWYSVSSSGTDTYVMSPVNDSSLSQISVAVKTDPNTNVKFVAVTVTGAASTTATHNYQYDFDALTTDQLTQALLMIWKAVPMVNANAQKVLAPNISTSSLSAISSSDIDGYDSLDVASKGNLQNGALALVKKDSSTGLHYSKNSDGYWVRIRDGVLYDDGTGAAISYISVSELADFLDTLYVSVEDVSKDDTYSEQLLYRVPATS